MNEEPLAKAIMSSGAIACAGFLKNVADADRFDQYKEENIDAMVNKFTDGMKDNMPNPKPGDDPREVFDKFVESITIAARDACVSFCLSEGIEVPAGAFDKLPVEASLKIKLTLFAYAEESSAAD